MQQEKSNVKGKKTSKGIVEGAHQNNSDIGDKKMVYNTSKNKSDLIKLKKRCPNMKRYRILKTKTLEKKTIYILAP
jgi:hypothetical protein